MTNHLYYGDNLDVLRQKIKDESVDLVYIDPPFNSQRNYNQIYNKTGKEDKAQAQAFIDTWEWDQKAKEGISQILKNAQGRFTPQTIELIKGLRNLLKEGSLFAYLVSMTLRIVEIRRVLKPTGSFYLHCDPTVSHYLKLLMDGIFEPENFRNEIIWKRAETVKGNFGQGSKRFDTNTDTLLFYRKTEGNIFNQQFEGYSENYIEDFYKYLEGETGRRYRLISMIGPGGAAKGNPQYEVMGVTRYWRYSKQKMQELIKSGLVIQTNPGTVPHRKQYLDEGKGVPIQSLWDDIPGLHSQSSERLGYPTQKPEALLERIIKASSNEGDTVLDAYCGCGTTVAVAQRLKRQWIGVDITYQSISLILKRLKESFGKEVLSTITLDGIPTDMESATALAHKQDDRVRKEFEKWAVLTYSEDRATINQKKGADGGIDGTAYFMTSKTENEKIIFQVKSGNVGPKDIRDLRGTIEQEKAPLGILLTLQEPTQPMIKAAHTAGLYHHPLMQRNYNKIQIITIRDMIEKRVRLEMPLTQEVVRSAPLATPETQQKELF